MTYLVAPLKDLTVTPWNLYHHTCVNGESEATEWVKTALRASLGVAMALACIVTFSFIGKNVAFEYSLLAQFSISLIVFRFHPVGANLSYILVSALGAIRANNRGNLLMTLYDSMWVIHCLKNYEKIKSQQNMNSAQYWLDRKIVELSNIYGPRLARFCGY